MAERPLYTLYKNLKAQNYDVPDDYNKFESALTRDGKGGADNRHAIYENLKAQNFDVPNTYERFYSALFEPRSKTSSRAKGGSVPMTAADRARFSAGAAAISASAQHTMNNAGRYNRLKQRKQKQKKDFGRVNLGTHQTPYGDANNVVKDDFAYNPETGKAGAYVSSDNENVYSQPEAEQKQAVLDQQNNTYQEAVDTGEIPSVFDVRDKNGNYDLQENINKNGTYLTEEGARNQFDKKLADAYARKKEIEAAIAEDHRLHGNPLLSYGASIGASNGRTAEQSDYSNKLATSLALVKQQIGALEAVKQYPTSSWGEDALKALDNTAFTAKTWDFGLTDFATMGQMERIKTKMDNNLPLSGSDKMLLKSKLGADAAAALEDEKMGNIYRWTKIAGQSLPFMADFFLTGGYGGITKAISRGALKFAAKRGMGKVSAAILKNTGIVAGDVIGSYAMAGSEQAMKTGADIMQRHLGSLYQDEKGDYKFGTFDENGNLLHDGGESMGTALYKGLTSAMVENYTEKLFGHSYGIKKGAINFMEKHGMNASAEFFKNIGKSGWYTNSKKWMEKFGINGFGEEVMEEEIGIPLHALLDGDNKFSDLLDTKQQLDIIGGMALSVGSMYAMGAGSRPVKGVYNRAQYYRFRNKVNVADSDAQNLMGDKWADIKDKIDNTTNEQMGGVLADILRQRDTMSKDQINAAINYGINLMKMRGYNVAKTAEMNAREITNEPTTPEEQHQEDIDNAYSEGHDADDANKHDIQLEHEDQMKTLAGLLNISEQQLSAMNDDELQSLTGQNDKLDQAIYDYQLSSARYQGVTDDAQDKIDMAANQAAQRVDIYTDKSRGSVRNATVKASGGAEDYGVYIISGNIATNEDGSINVADSDDMILFYDPTTNSVEYADALRFAELGDEVPADDVKAQAVADAKEKAIKEVAGIVDGTIDVGSQFSVTDVDGTEHTYEVLADNGDGTAMITIDGNVPTELVKGENVQIPYSFADLQQLKDAEDLKRLEAAKTQREQMEKERAAQQTEQTLPSFDFKEILNDNGNVVEADVIGKDGNSKFPNSKIFLIRNTGAKAKVVELKSDGTLKSHAVNKEDVQTATSMSLEEYKQARFGSSIIEENSGSIEANRSGIEVEDNTQPLSEADADNVIAQMESSAEVAPESELTPDNWTAEFGEDGIVSTPIGEVKMGENQVAKLFEKGRSKEFGMIKPTLTNPDVIIEVPSHSADGNEERSSSYLFIKTFLGKNGEKVYYFKSVTIKKDGLEISISSHYDRAKRVKEALMKGKLLYRKNDGAQTEQNQPSTSVTTSQEDAAGSSESKDTNISSNDNENNESLTFEDGTPIPVDVNGEVDLSQTDAAHAAEWYDNNLGEDADDWLDGEINKAKKVLEQAKNKKLAGTKPSELVASKKEKETAIADAQTHYDSAISIRDSLKERRIAKEENTPEGRKNLIEKARRKFSRLKSAVKDDAEAVSQLYKDVVGSLLHRLYDGTGIDVTDTIPLTAEEYVASNLGAHSLNYEGTETSKGVKQETGLSREDFAKTQLLAADGKGTTIDDLVHSLWENRPSNLESLDTQDIRNALIGLLNSGFKASEARNYIENLRIAQAENILEEQKKAADNAAFAEENKAESEQQTETAPESEEKTGEDNSDEINDEENEQTNENINAPEVPEDATEENPLGAQRDQTDLPFSARDNGTQQTTSERAADVEKNKVDDMKVVDNIVGEKTRKAFERLAKMMGVSIQWQYSDKLGNGWIQETTDADGNVHRTIFITLDSSITEGAQFIFGHEMTHQIKSLNPAAYNELTRLVIDTYGADAYDKEIDETMKRYSDAGFSGRARDYYAEEVVADAVGEMIRDLNLAHTLAMKMSHPLLAAIHEILQKIKLAFFGTEYSDVTKNIIRSIEQAYVKTAKGEVTNSETGEDVSFSLRQKPEPKKKGIGYKVFVLKDGKLYPPMVANPNGAATPVGVWLDADAAPIAGESKTGRPQVKQGGKGTQGGSGKLAYRPGWHLGVVPYAIQFNRKDAEGNKTLFPKNFVFAEVEYAADVDYQEEARQEGINPSGKYQHSLAGLKHLPTDGYYMYRTNPNPETDPWVITGAMKVNRILTRAEQADLVSKAGREPQQIQEGDIVTDDVVNSINQEIADAPKFSIKTYHGSQASFDKFDHSFMGSGEGAQAYGWGTYVSEVEGIAKAYAKSNATIHSDNGYKEALYKYREADFNYHITETSYKNAVKNLKEKEQLAHPKIKNLEKELDEAKSSGDTLSVGFLETALKNWNEVLQTARKEVSKYEDTILPNDKDVLEKAKKRMEELMPERNLYSVDIPDDTGDNYIGWDEPLTDKQVEMWKNAANSLAPKDDDGGWKERVDYYARRYGYNFRGEKAYKLLTSERTPKEVSLALKDAGFDGVKVVAQRNAGDNKEGKMNYVIFDENNAKITSHIKFSLRLKSAIEDTETNPSDAQKESGNYKKGHIKFGGYDYTIENPKGSTRSGKDANGKEWKVTMHDTYGYIRGKFGKDGDHLDMFINDKADLDNWDGDVFIVDQVNPDGSFDEHKVMYGYDSMDDAKKAYLANYSDGWKGLGNITGASKDEFDKWLDTSNRKLKPFKDYAKVKFSLKDIKPVGVGAFGNIYNQFRGKAKAAIEFLKKLGSGEATAALHHHTIGDISLVWGDKKTGLDKILRKHPEVVDNLQSIIDSMEVVQESDNRIKLESPTHFAVVSKEYKGEPREQWLLTAYEKRESLENGKSMDTATSSLGGDTALSQSKESAAKIDNSSETAKENGEKFSLKDEKIKSVAEKFGVNEDDVAMYANAVERGSTAEAARARANIKRYLLQANEDKISSFKDIIKYTKPINEALKENFGDLDAMIEERRKQVEAQRNAMEAARKRAQEEEEKRQKHLDELSLIPTDELDKRYMDAIANNDESTAREMLDESARRNGYGDVDSDYQGQGAWAAPSNPQYESDEVRRADIENSPDVNLEDIALGYNLQPDDYFDNPRAYMNNTAYGLESAHVIKNALDAIKNGEKDVKVKVYRAVPTSVKEGKLRNGDWVTPSKKYAEMHGDNRLDGKYRIIEDEVPANQLWWDGNDVNEFGFDDGKEYRYKNAKNNRKLNDLITYDNKGNVIPPSKRFNSRKSDIRFSLRDMADGKESGAADMAEDLKSLNTPDEVDDAIKTAIDDMPIGWQMANKKMIHIAQALGENRKAEIAGEEPKFSLKNGTLIKAGTYFSGGGLVEEGLKGIIDPVVAVEYDEKISGVYRNNFGQHIVTADVRDVDPKELVKQIDGEVEYFHASPVCKNYSQAKSNHAEVELDKETAASTAEFINSVKPKVVTIENVKGYKDSEAMKIITDALDANGYTWDADVYNAADYGGYTNRERLIVRAVRDGKLPEKPKKMAHKSGWYEAVADIIPTLTEKKNGVANWMDIRLKADGIDWRHIDKPLYVMGSAYADGKIPHAFADELLPTLRTKSGDVIVMPDGKVYRAMGRVLARVSGVSDDYKMPFSENLSHTIIGNGIPTQLTEHVIAPLLTGSDPKFSIRTYHGTGASFDKFDLSHALEGEGSESFGHGVYVTNSSKIGREYAQRAKNRKMEDLYKNMRYPDGVKGDIFKRRVFGEMVNDVATGGSVASAKEFAKKRVGADANDIQRTLENLKDREKGTEYEQNLKDRLAEYKEGLKWIDSLDEDYLTQGNVNRYDVDIPDDNGSNYLDWEGTIPDSLDKQKVAEDAYKVVSDNQGFNDFKATPLNDFIAHTLKTYVNTTDVAGRVEKLKSDIKDVIENYVADDDVLALNEYLKDATPDDVLATIWYNDLVRDIKDADLGEELYRKLSTYVGDNAASQILSDNGLVGIKYPAGMIHGGAKEGDYNYVIFDENNANIVGNTRFSLRYDQFEHDLNQWKKDNNLPKDAQRPTIPQRNAGESAVDFLRRVDEYRKQMALWKTAPTYEQHLLSDDTALGEFNRELQRGSVLKRIAFQDSMLAIRKAQEAIMKEVGVDRLNMAEDAYTAENRSHGKGKNEFEEYNNDFLQPLRKAYHQMKKVLGDSYDNVRVYMMAKHGLERDAQMAFKKSLEADYEDVNQRSAAYKAYKNDLDRVSNDADLEFGRVDFTTWRQKDNALRGKYSPSYMDYRYDDNGIAYDYSGLSSLFDGSDFEEAAHRLVRDVETKHLAEVQALWNATNAATKKILRDGFKAGMMSKDAYEYVKGMYSHYIPLRGWDGTTADQVWDYIGGGKGAFNQTLKTAHGRTSIADDPIAYIENMAESGILLNNKNWVKQHLMLLAQNHPTSLLTLSKAWYVKSTDANGNEEWIPATPQITSQMNSNQVKAAIDAFEQKIEQMAQTGDATQQRDGLNIAYPQTHSEEREHEVRVMKDGEEYVIYVNGDPQLAQAMNNTRAHRVREIQSGKLDRAAAWLGRKMAAAYTSLSPLFIPSNYFRDLTMTLASTAIREDAKYNYLLRKNLATSWNLGFMLRDYQNGKLRDKVNNGNATSKEQMFYDFMMNGGETGFVSSLDVEDLKKKFKNDLKDLDRWKANPVKVGHTIMDGIEFLNRMIEDSNRFAVYMTSIQYGRSIDEAVNDAKDVTLNFNRKGTGEYGWQMIRNLYLFINPAVQSLQTLGALAKHHPFKFTAVTAAWLASGVLVPIVNAALMSLLGGDDDKDKYWQFTKWDRRNNLIMWVPFTHEYVKIPLAQEFRAFYGAGDMIASKMMGGELAEETWSQYAEDLLGQVVDMLPLDPTGYDGNIAVSLMPNPIRPVFELAFNVDFTGKPLFKETEYNKYDPNFTKAYVGTPDWLVRVSKMVNSIGNDYPDVQQNAIDAFGDPRYNLNNPAVVDHVLSSYLGGAYTMGSQVFGVLTKSLNDPKEIKMADIPLVSKFVSNPDDRPVTKKQGDEFWNMKENHDRAANTLSKLKKQAKVDGDYSMLERFYGSEEYKQYKQEDVKVKKYEEDKKKERADESGEEYRPHKLNAEDIYKAHTTPKDDFEDLKLKQLYTKLNGFKTSYDLLVDTAPSQSDGYYNTNKVAIDAIDEISLDKQEISELKKGFLEDGKDAYNAEDMKRIRELRKRILSVLEPANKVVVANQKAKAEKK